MMRQRHWYKAGALFVWKKKKHCFSAMHVLWLEERYFELHGNSVPSGIGCAQLDCELGNQVPKSSFFLNQFRIISGNSVPRKHYLLAMPLLSQWGTQFLVSVADFFQGAHAKNFLYQKAVLLKCLF